MGKHGRWLKVAWGRGTTKGAIAAAERYLELNPSDANTYNMLAYNQARLGDFQAAVSSVKKYVSLHPDVGNAYDSAWEIHLWAGLYDEALAYAETLSRSCVRNPRSPRTTAP